MITWCGVRELGARVECMERGKCRLLCCGCGDEGASKSKLYLIKYVEGSDLVMTKKDTV